MKTLNGIIRYEFKMSIKRRGIQVLSLFLAAFYAVIAYQNGILTKLDGTTADTWREIARVTFSLNFFIPVMGGILAADRLVRDLQLNTRELLLSTQMRSETYILGKYLGVLGSLLLPAFAVNLLMGLGFILLGNPWSFLPRLLLTTLCISLPSLVFVTAFSLVCPLFMPVRVYQILFTGYWFWGNYLYPEIMPTLSDTLLNASGRYLAFALFGLEFTPGASNTLGYALANLALLAGITLLVLLFGGLYLKKQATAA